MMEADLRKFNFVPGQNQWGFDKIKEIGEDAFYSMRNAMYKTLNDIPEGKYFDIASVKPENQEMFVKTTCEFMLLQNSPDYRFNRLMNKIYHEKKLILKKNEIETPGETMDGAGN